MNHSKPRGRAYMQSMQFVRKGHLNISPPPHMCLLLL